MSPVEWLEAQTRFARERLSDDERPAFLRSVIQIHAAMFPQAQEDWGLLSPAEFCARVGEPKPHLVENWFLPRSITMLSGKPKHGKTFFLLQLAQDIAEGANLLGNPAWKVNAPGLVVLYLMEDGSDGLNRRMRQRGWHTDSPNVALRHTRHDFSTLEGVIWMLEDIDKLPEKPTLVVVDTSRQAFRIRDRNDDVAVTEGTRTLYDSVRGTSMYAFPENAALLLTHHNNKYGVGGDAIGGAGAWYGEVDSSVQLVKKVRLDNGDLAVDCEGSGRWDIPEKFSWVMDTHTYRIRLLDKEEVAAAKAAEGKEELAKRLNEIGYALKELGGEGTSSEVAIEMGANSQRVSEWLRDGAKEGRWNKTSRTKKGDSGRAAAIWELIKDTRPYKESEI